MSKTELKSENSELLYKLHFKKVFREAVAISHLNCVERVLDFGCGTQHLKRHLLKSTSYLGFDINPKRSDINSITCYDFDTIFAINVLEHLSETELTKTFAKFRATGARQLVVSLPAENILFNFLSILTKGNLECFWYHKTSAKKVALLLLEEFGFPTEIKQVDGLKYLASFKIEERKNE